MAATNGRHGRVSMQRPLSCRKRGQRRHAYKDMGVGPPAGPLQGTMPADTHAATPHAVDAAIMRVLGAEQAARGEVQRCSAAAEQLRQDARTQSRRIAERAAERVARVHRAVDASIHARIDALEQQRRALLEPSATGADEPERIASALDRLAAELGDGSA
jgi:hypothetical protein